MRSYWRMLYFLAWVFMNAGCNNNPDRQGMVINDSLQLKKDAEDFAYRQCYENFFSGLPGFKDSTSVNLEMKDGRKLLITEFFREEFLEPISQYGKKDLDDDGIMELVIYNYTGGAHCCDEFFIFRQKNPADFAFQAHIIGRACIDADNNTFTFSFRETLGYFFSCYACAFADSTQEITPMHEIRLKYVNGNLVVVKYTPAIEQQNLVNLAILQKHGYEAVEGIMDSGWRKEFAINFAVWHYNHGKDWPSTRELFRKYYTYKDSVVVWNEFHITLKEAETENTF